MKRVVPMKNGAVALEGRQQCTAPEMAGLSVRAAVGWGSGGQSFWEPSPLCSERVTVMNVCFDGRS